ncbi:Glutathione S-transferase 7 [Bulinus truncatus]|nr:Glutathione S-transferase 7 [Bulinus truncatus]
MAPKNIKIIYFDARGRAEVCRIILAAAGQSWDDVRHTKETWPTEKPNTPFGQLPVLEIDGKRYAQSIAMANYCAREFDGLQIDQVVQLGNDFLSAAVKAFYESDENKKAELLKNLKEVEAPKYLTFFERLLKESGTGYFVGNSLTLADIYVYDLIYSFSKRGQLTTDGYPHLQELTKIVESNDKIKKYLASRKDTEN